jgi:hypothetical protein
VSEAGGGIGIGWASFGGFLSSSHLAELENGRRDHISGIWGCNWVLLLARPVVDAVRYWQVRHIDGCARSKPRVGCDAAMQFALAESAREACRSNGFISVAGRSHMEEQ